MEGPVGQDEGPAGHDGVVAIQDGVGQLGGGAGQDGEEENQDLAAAAGQVQRAADQQGVEDQGGGGAPGHVAEEARVTTFLKSVIFGVSVRRYLRRSGCTLLRLVSREGIT